MNSASRNLLISVLSMILCIAMLTGVTFAWFTDSVSSGVNTIVAGNLDIELEYWDGVEWIDVDSSTLLFNENARWEPGHTEIAYLHIKNSGALSLTYKLAVNVVEEVPGTNAAGDTFKLSDYLVFNKVDMASPTAFFSYDESGRAQARAAAGSVTGLASYMEADNLYPENDTSKPENAATEKYIALVIYMPETVGNEANYMPGTTAPRIKLGISLVATQLGSESDSFGSDYDSLVDGYPDNVES